MKDILVEIGAFVVTLLIMAVFSLLFGWLVALLWNWLMPTIFGLTTITYWQGVGLLWLSGMLFKSNTTSKQS